MGFKGKKKETAPKAPAMRQVPQEFSDEDDEDVFSEDDADYDEDAFEKEDDLLAHLPAEEEDDDEDEEDEDDEDNEGEAVHWGKKSSFFKRDEDEEEEEEDQELEENEAARLLRKRQAGLKKEFMQLGSDDDEEESEEEEQPQVMAKKQAQRGSDDLLASEAPEVDALLKEFTAKAKEIRQSIAPALQRLQSAEEDARTEEGIAYLETKTHLLLSYITNVCFYLLYRAEHGGAQAESHPVVSQLVRLRTLLDKLRPLDAKLKNEVDELVRRAALQIHREQQEDGEEGGEDEQDQQQQRDAGGNKKKKFEFRPDLNDLNQDNEDGDLPGAEEGEDMEEEDKPRKSHKQLLRRAQKSKFIQELLQNEDEPEEITSELKQIQTEEDLARQRYEEENYTRLPENKKDRKRKAELLRKNATHGGLLSTLEQELDEEEYSKFRDLLEDEDDTLLGMNKQQQRTGGSAAGALSMHLNEMSQARKDGKKVHRGGDDDAEPKKKKLLGATAARAVQHEDDGADGGDAGFESEHEVASDEEHPFYKETVKRRKLANQEKEEAYEFPKRYAPEPVQLVEMGQARRATKEMIKNRGLTAHRNKDTKNPRSHLRAKYEAKVKARRGQVRDVRKGEADAYQGERTGIRSNLVRSRQAGKL